ncbi:hypothetical protein SAMN05444407_103175 [Chryseobacterium contaminans]|uniref:Uncharacterized protein n=1 Tax=Chryseobacterium contaminans TaxID=1423959 RepID=A0A1M6ZCQ0_9FLAO|nr:hypothetical protein SAMN05444407_103175 [Chryseobacterium contaminans]
MCFFSIFIFTVLSYSPFNNNIRSYELSFFPVTMFFKNFTVPEDKESNMDETRKQVEIAKYLEGTLFYYQRVYRQKCSG